MLADFWLCTGLILSLHPSIQGSVLDGFGDMSGLDLGTAGEVGDGSAHFEYTVEGSGREAETVEGGVEEGACRVAEGTEPLDLVWAHRRIECDRGPGRETLLLE